MQDTAGRALRLRMGHLLIWVVGCAVGFAAYRSITSAAFWHYGVDNRRLNSILVHVYAIAVVLGALAILAAIALDRRSGASGDGLHRLGVGVWLAIAAIQLVMYGLYLAG